MCLVLMGDLQDWSADQNLGVIEADCWDIAEQATPEILARVQATLISEKRRNDVIVFVQKLIKDSLGCEVFQFGSVPLKTYLPDGDIDLTAFGSLNHEDALADDVYSVLEREEHNTAGNFVVKDVQLVPAEVKLVKCLVQNIVVDISFNQLGGLCTLCFLEQVDRLIGKSNLFKRSIVLIKAWCYYESRILGAHHGLISTYALEILVLYIFHLFHSSLNGPLGVLYKFLEYFSKFDWDSYCISLNGPISISSLPELVAVAPENDGGELLFSDAFLKDCMNMFADSSRVSETISRGFPVKHLNIVDPLRETNNLGRSISKGNFYRVQSALNFGARKLGQILSLPEESISDEIRNFFSNTLDRHDNDARPDVQELSSSLEDNLSSEFGSSNYLEESSCKEMELSTPQLMDGENHANMTDVSGFSCSDDAKDIITPSVQDFKITDEMYRPCYTYSEVKVSYEEKNTVRDNHKTDTVVVSKSILLNPSSLDALAVELDPDNRKNRDTFDFSGEFVNHLNNLQCGRWLYNYALNATTQWSLLLSQGMLSHSANSYFSQTGSYLPMSLGFIPGSAFDSESKPKTRGTGTYFPNTNHYRDNRPSNQRTRNQAHVRSPRYNGHAAISPGRMGFSGANGAAFPPEYRAEFALSVDPLPYTTQFDQNSNTSLPIPVPQAQRQTSLLDANQDTAAKKSWRLKDFSDFPPLSI